MASAAAVVAAVCVDAEEGVPSEAAAALARLPLAGAQQKLGSGDWSDTTQMVQDGSSLYLVCGKMNGGRGGGGLYRVDLATGDHLRVGTGNWENATQLIQFGHGDARCDCGLNVGSWKALIRTLLNKLEDEAEVSSMMVPDRHGSREI